MAMTKRPPPTSELDSGGWTFRVRGFAHGPFEPSISGCLTGDLGVPGYEPDGISWLPHPATSAHRATARRRSSVRIGTCRINLSRASFRRTYESARGLPESPSIRSEEHTSELQSLTNLVCRLLLEKKK